MKKNAKRFLSTLLSLVMLLCVLPVTSFAAGAVEHIEITGVTAPVVGEDADFSWNIPIGKGCKKATDLFGDNCCWIKESLWGDIEFAFESGLDGIYITFEEGYYYSFEAWVTPTLGSYFSDDLTATINGMDAEVWLYEDGSVGISCLFDNLIGELVDSIDITGVTAPVVGEDADFNWSIPDDVNYSKYSDSNSDTCYWIESEDWFDSLDDFEGITAYESGVGGNFITFEKGLYYTFVAQIKLADGFRFDPYGDIYINGNEAFTDILEDGTVYIYYPFDTLDIIESIEITGVTAPEMGKPASFSWSIPDNANYKKFFDSDGDSCCWIESPSGPDPDEFWWDSHYAYESGLGDCYITFVGAKYYGFQPFIEPAKGYKFAENLTVTVNGTQIIIDNHPSHYSDILFTFDNLADIKLEELKVTPPTDTTYNYMANVSLSGLKVVAAYSDGSEVDVTDRVDVYGYYTLRTGRNTAIIDFCGETASFDYTVKYTWWQWIIKIVFFGWLWY